MQVKDVTIREIRDALLKSIKQSKDWKNFHHSLEQANKSLEKVQQLKHITIFLTLISLMSFISAIVWPIVR